MTRQKNIAVVTLWLEKGCDPKEGEYELLFEGFSLSFRLADVELVQAAIENDFDFAAMQPETLYTITLKEDGEWEDVFWNKYYTIIDIDTGFPERNGTP